MAALVVTAVAVCVNATPVLASGPTVPDAPSITGITIGRNTVMVDFSPNDDGGDPITGYTVTCTSSDGGATASNTDVALADHGCVAEQREHVQLRGGRHELGRRQRSVGPVRRLHRDHGSRRADDHERDALV